MKFDTSEQLDDSTVIASQIVESFHFYRKIGLAPLAMSVLSSLLDTHILRSPEYVWKIGSRVWDAWHSLEAVVVDIVLDSNDSEIEETKDSNVVMQIQLLNALNQTLIEFFLLPVNYDRMDGVPGLPIETLALW